MKKFLWLFLLPLLLGAASQDTGWLTRSDCGTLSNPMTNGTVCLQTTTVSGRTAGHFYSWNGAAWIDVTGNIGAAITALTSDVTASGPGAATATIANNAVTTGKINNSAVTLAKIQNAAASNKLLGSGATGSGSPYTEITLGSNLSMTGTTLSATGGGGTGCTTSGTSILQGDGAGGCSNVTVGSGLDFTGGTLTSTGAAPDTAHYVTTQAESGLSAEFNLGGLTTGLLKHSVSAGVSTPATAVAGTDYAAAPTGTANTPLFNDGSGGFTNGTRSGNTTKVVTMDASTPSTNDCAKWDANGNLTTAATPCGSGGGTLDGARVYNSANESITNATLTALTFNSERFDNGGMHSTVTNTDRLTAQTAGYYLITGNVSFATSGTGDRYLYICLNGTATIIALQGGIPSGAAGQLVLNVSTVYHLAANDYVLLVVFQTSGGDLNVESSANYSPEFSAQLITQ